MSKMTGIELIAQERQKQIEQDGWTQGHDVKEHPYEELAKAAACYALPEDYRQYKGYDSKHNIPVDWPWSIEHWKPTPYNRIRELTKAGALIAAEIDRLQAIEGKENE